MTPPDRLAVARFQKLQDAVGERLLPATLAEPYEDWPMPDRLDRLERLAVAARDQPPTRPGSDQAVTSRGTAASRPRV